MSLGSLIWSAGATEVVVIEGMVKRDSVDVTDDAESSLTVAE